MVRLLTHAARMFDIREKVSWRQYMKNLYKVLVMLLVMAATLLLANCAGGAPGCPQAAFGGTPCAPGGAGGLGGGGGSGGGGGGGGGGASSPTAFAYAVDQNGTMDGYAFSASGKTFGPISGFSAPAIAKNTGGVGSVVAQGKYLYTVIEDTQQIYGWTIGSDGSLAALANFPILISGLTGIAATTYNQQVVITNPSGTMLFIDQFIPEQIFVYQIASTGQLTLATGSPFSTLNQTLEPQNMAMDGLGRFLYVAEDSGDHSGAFVVGYSVSGTGQLTPIPNYFTWGNIPIWQMQGEPSGNYMLGISAKVQFIYGSDDPHINVYSVDQTSGALSPVANSPFATTYDPFNIAVQPTLSNGEYVYSFSINDTDTAANPIEAYQINTTTGALTAVNGSPFGGLTQTAWGQFDQSGQYLFIYTGVSPNFSLGVLNVSSTGALTETVGTTALQTGGYFAVADTP